MNPSLTIFGGVELPSYFTMVTIGFMIGLVLAWRWAQHHRLDHRLMIDFVIWMALWGIIGSRLLHVVADGHFWDYVHLCSDPSQVDWKVDVHECAALEGRWDESTGLCHPTERNCWAWADITAGGFAYYGGLIAAALFAWRFIRRHRLPVGKMLDLGGFAITLGVAWGRMGCLLASCCFGARWDGPLAVRFPPGSSPSRHHWELGLLDSYRVESLPVHPAQAYESLGCLLLAAGVYFLLRPRKRFDGQVFVVAMIGYAVLRFALEFIRRDERGEVGPLSTSQLIALLAVALCAGLWIVLSRRTRRALESTES
jgi:phosphatidylglycerol---prolipoprotein diacylglyceryl transferase